MRHQHGHVHLHNVQRRQQEDPWEQFTSAVGEAFNPMAAADESPTEIHTVFKTMAPDGFTGELTTLTDDTEPTPTPESGPKKTPTATTSRDREPFTSDTSKMPASIVPNKTATKVASSLAVDTGSPTRQPKGGVAATAASASSESASAQNGGGESAGAKAGIVIGVLAGVLVVFLLIFFAFRKRRKQAEKQRVADDEKINGPFSDSAAIGRNTPTGTNPNAPRLSLRPVTEFLPTVGAGQHPDRRASKEAPIAMVASPNMNRAAGGSAWERQVASPGPQPGGDPFGDHARLRTPTGQDHTPVSPISDTDDDFGSAFATNSPSGRFPIAAAAATAGGAAAGMTRKTSIRKDSPKALDLTVQAPTALSTVPASPAGTEFSVTSMAPGQVPGPSSSAAAIAAAGGPPTSAVHRVQLDFKPTLEDEMGLRAGQLIRLLHEYDDGWALCIRLDRTQQGVVPRTCLSTRPVKPKPAQGGPRGPPVNPSGPGARGPNYPPGQRPMTPQGGPGYPRPESPSRPMTAPHSGRPQSPAGRPMSPYGGARAASPAGRPMSPYGGPRPSSPAGRPAGRPMSPGPRAMSPGPRAQSPGPRYEQDRSQSPNGSTGRRMSPPGPSAMQQEYRPGPPPSGPIGRKPVPGQAY